MTSPSEIARLLHYMPIICAAPDISDWERQFAISIAGRLKRGAFNPSEKQVSVMTSIVARFQAETMTDLIEGHRESER